MSELLDRALKVIRELQPSARDKGFELIGVVGSVARGEEHPGSDIDIAYDVISPKASLLGLGGVYMDLQEALGRPIGLIDISVAKPHWRPVLERDLVPA